jgi:ABC-type bacteriocin/lantibiotic exporter with double-glycine peptidase domain
MTLVLLACLPLLGAVGLALSKLSARIESSSADAYAQAQDLAQQAMTQVGETQHVAVQQTARQTAPV